MKSPYKRSRKSGLGYVRYWPCFAACTQYWVVLEHLDLKYIWSSEKFHIKRVCVFFHCTLPTFCHDYMFMFVALPVYGTWYTNQPRQYCCDVLGANTIATISTLYRFTGCCCTRRTGTQKAYGVQQPSTGCVSTCESDTTHVVSQPCNCTYYETTAIWHLSYGYSVRNRKEMLTRQLS